MKYYIAILFTIITFGSIVIVSSFFNKELEAVIAVISFHIFREFDKEDKVNSYHAKAAVECFIHSLIIFTVLVRITVPVEYSIAVTIVLSLVLAVLMHHVKQYLDYIKLRHSPDILDKLEIALALKEITQVCYNRIKLRYVDKLKYSEIANLESVQLDTITKWFQRNKILIKRLTKD